ncbi:hypothetical protein Bca52824_078509 [Brassica carinata]|uniref:MD-2-related lipid-recognition domain-containing protein n=1 Tax=Brassica carinata TaxID=52824 RepID=A0A8X7TY85_BRACI|nr:hypothetical protein Bca52824_078509 [Brassica carinata]
MQRCGITGGKLVIEVTYFGWHIHSETHDLCSETSCPAETGDFLVAHSQVLPGYTPPMFHLMPTPQGSFYVFNDIFRSHTDLPSLAVSETVFFSFSQFENPSDLIPFSSVPDQIQGFAKC